MPEVSVFIPAYNAAPYLAAAVESILQQTFRDLEVIVVDDGSTDGTAQVLEAYDDPRLRVIRQENQGISGASNTGISAARGPLVARLDADDVAYPERLERQVAYMREHPDCVLVGTGVDMLCPAGLVLYEKKVPADHEEIARALWSGDSQAVVHPTMMAQREVVEHIGGYRTQYSTVEDFDLYLRLLPLGRFANLPVALVGYRQHPASTNATRYEEQLAKMRRIVAELGSCCPYEGLERPLLNGWARSSPSEFYRRCGWNALKLGHYAAARDYARRALRAAPCSMANWRLAYCLMRERARRGAPGGKEGLSGANGGRDAEAGERGVADGREVARVRHIAESANQ
jgi:glycosyltransferase involved in cell wall biosynthesis